MMWTRKQALFVADQRDVVARILDGERWRALVSRLRLSPRERQIVESMLLGMDTEVRIAERLQMSPRTVQTHIQRLREKMRASSREQLLATILVECLANDKSACL